MQTIKEKKAQMAVVYEMSCGKCVERVKDLTRCTCETCVIEAMETACAAVLFTAARDAMKGRSELLKKIRDAIQKLVAEEKILEEVRNGVA